MTGRSTVWILSQGTLFWSDKGIRNSAQDWRQVGVAGIQSHWTVWRQPTIQGSEDRWSWGRRRESSTQKYAFSLYWREGDGWRQHRGGGQLPSWEVFVGSTCCSSPTSKLLHGNLFWWGSIGRTSPTHWIRRFKILKGGVVASYTWMIDCGMLMTKRS